MNGATPSYTRQTEHDMIRMAREHAEAQAKENAKAEDANKE